MANRHEVTVHIWRNSAAYEIIQDNQQDRTHRPGLDPGHASLKLQRIGAEKGDYIYLSFWPGGDGNKMSIAYGPRSQAIRAAELSTVVMSRTTRPKRWDTRLEGREQRLDDLRADMTYRFTGPDYRSMRGYILGLGGVLKGGVVSDPKRWRLRKFNCSEAVATCLEMGSAPLKPNYDGKFTPNRLEEWCRRLVEHYDGEMKDPRTGEITSFEDGDAFVVPASGSFFD